MCVFFVLFFLCVCLFFSVCVVFCMCVCVSYLCYRICGCMHCCAQLRQCFEAKDHWCFFSMIFFLYANINLCIPSQAIVFFGVRVQQKYGKKKLCLRNEIKTTQYSNYVSKCSSVFKWETRVSQPSYIWSFWWMLCCFENKEYCSYH